MIFNNTCIKKCGRRAGGTPWLCLPCVRSIVREYVYRNNPYLYDELFEVKYKNMLNRVQKQSRKAFKRHG